jgi:hypothetical protein
MVLVQALRFYLDSRKIEAEPVTQQAVRLLKE